MLIQRLDTVILFVSDLERNLQWYQEVLKLHLESHRGDYAVFDLGNARLALHAGAEPGSPDKRAATTPALEVEDYRAAKATLQARGCTFVFENKVPHAIFGTTLDPDGNPVQIIQRLER
jgi:catechol 2,3-dioxygenase-like lactoylglutathione lyase family enzyme